MKISQADTVGFTSDADKLLYFVLFLFHYYYFFSKILITINFCGGHFAPLALALAMPLGLCLQKDIKKFVTKTTHFTH